MGRPRTEVVAKQVEEEDPEEEDAAEKLEIRRALIEEVRKRPRIWETALRQSRFKNKYFTKEDWVDVMKDMEIKFRDSVLFNDLFPGEIKTLKNEPSVHFSSKEESLKKMKKMWLDIVKSLKRLTEKKDHLVALRKEFGSESLDVSSGES